MTTVSDSFSSCTLDFVAEESPSIELCSDGTWKTSAFYVDSSGRSRISMPLRLTLPSRETMDEFIAKDCIHPMPSNFKKDKSPDSCKSEKEGDENITTEDQQEGSRLTLGIEAKVTLTFGSGQAVAAKVEGVNIIATKIDENNNSIIFDSEAVVRVSRTEGDLIVTSSGDAISKVKTNLEISAVLSEEVRVDQDAAALKVFQTLTSRGFVNHDQQTSIHKRMRQTRVAPVALGVSLTHALFMSVSSVKGSSMGQTLVSFTLRHSNMHSEPVTITNISLHPGHSRHDRGQQLDEDHSMREGQHSITDMSRSFRWGYAPKSDPDLPLTLGPHEAFSSIIVVDSTEDMSCQNFLSPISVTAIVGKHDRLNRHYSIVADSEFQWMASRTSVRPADAFQIDMILEEMDCTVGSPLNVILKISNLSEEDRDLMVVVTKDEEKGDFRQQEQSTKNLAVSEKVGHKFGVWGLVSDEGNDITVDCDRELLSVDTALLLGEMKGNASTEAKLRFIPLQEGTLNVPNLTLVDKIGGKMYSCIHNLRIVCR